ncbi:MAG: GlsB/YeaQ/YmgE family stress response membrane protein [Ruminococcaceae bacterium]|nr:GlsB/YeaQ/YmgE family stress response membrane protein [Oscillospiraceae bacterium]
MDFIISTIISIALGALAGWLAGKIMKDEGSLLRNIIVGIVGGWLGGFLFGLIGLGLGFIGSVIGACLLLWLIKKFKK